VMARQLAACYARNVSALMDLWTRPRLARRSLEAFRDSCVRRLIKHAYANVRYYRQLFDSHGIDPAKIRTVDDLQYVPITSKKDLQSQAPSDLVVSGIDPQNLIVTTTNGSSGRPLVVRRTWLEQNWLHTFRLRAHRYFGRSLGDRMVRISYVRSIDHRDSKALGRTLRRLHVYRVEEISMSLEDEDIIAKLKELQPDVLNGYPGVLARLAVLMTERDRSSIAPRFVMTGAEVLTRQQRAQIKRGFGAPVFDLYGSSEFNLIAWECRDTGEMHVCDDAVALEVVQDGRLVSAGEHGEVVSTSLHSYAMPFIRYKLDDVVTKGSNSCPCGLPYSTVRTVQGRVVDYFVLPSGRLFHPWGIGGLIENEQDVWIAQYELLQERRDLIVLQVVSFGGPPPGRISSLTNSVNALLGGEVRFEVRFVDEIRPDRGGKYRVYRSLVRPDVDSVAPHDKHDSLPAP
jgi:phenylacetate-CoA ligase